MRRKNKKKQAPIPIPKYVFGWISPQIKDHFEKWSTWKEIGSEAEAAEFYADTNEVAQQKRLEWFCIEQPSQPQPPI